MVTYDQQEFTDFYILWEDELVDGQNYSPDWAQYRSPTAVKLVGERAASYGCIPAVSLFIRAFNELRASGAIMPVRAPKSVATDEPELTAEQYNRMPAAEIIRRYRSEPSFKEDVDRLIRLGLI